MLIKNITEGSYKSVSACMHVNEGAPRGVGVMETNFG